jgi:hypothetical protein
MGEISDNSENWVSVKEFSRITGTGLDEIHEMISSDSLNYKEIDGVIYLDTTQSGKIIAPKVMKSLTTSNDNNTLNLDFVEKTISTILNLHEKVLSSKDETLDVLKEENMFLKEALISVQEILEQERENVKVLSEQLKNSQDELNFVKKKYKLMWGKVVDGYNTKSEF